MPASNLLLESPLRPAYYQQRSNGGISKMSFEVRHHQLVCKHSKASDSEKEALLKKYEIGTQDLPKILLKDSAIRYLNPKAGDVIKIERKSKTAGKTNYYRVVIEG